MLINGAMKTPPPAAAPAQQAGGNIVQRIVTAALTLLNQDAIEKQIITMIQSASDPAQGVAQAFVFVLRMLHEKAKAMPMQAFGQAGKPILEEILKVADSANVIQATPEFLQQVMQNVQAALSPQGGQQAPQVAAPAAPAPPVTAQPQGV